MPLPPGGKAEPLPCGWPGPPRDQELPGMWERADFEGGQDVADEWEGVHRDQVTIGPVDLGEEAPCGVCDWCGIDDEEHETDGIPPTEVIGDRS